MQSSMTMCMLVIRILGDQFAPERRASCSSCSDEKLKLLEGSIIQE